MKTIYRLIRLYRMVNSPRLRAAGVLGAEMAGMRHLFVRLDPTLGCNLRCMMCHYSDPHYRAENKGAFTPQDLRRIGDMFFPLAVQCVIGCAAEPTLYDDLPGLIRLAKHHGVPFVGMATNGQRLDESLVRALANEGLSEIVISLHGIRKQTYERLMKNASYERLHETLAHIDTVKKSTCNKTPELRLNYTLNPDNLEELSELAETFGTYSINTVQIRPMVSLGNTQYPHRDLAGLQERYSAIISALAAQCRKRGIVLLAGRLLNAAGTHNAQADILPMILRHIRPQKVWRTDFDWKHETYRQFCKRIGWRKMLVGTTIKGPGRFLESHRSLTYDVGL